MRFRCDGGEFDTDRLTAYPTRNRAMPFIYISPDFAHVFVQMMDPVQGVSIRLAPADEIRQLADTYHMPQLLRAVPRSNASSAEGSADTSPPGRPG